MLEPGEEAAQGRQRLASRIQSGDQEPFHAAGF